MRGVGKIPGAAIPMAAVMAALLFISALDAGKPAAAQGSCDLLCSGGFWVNAGIEDVRRELERAADPNARAENSRTPLHWAAGNSKTPTVVALLLKRGADLNARDKTGWTPLHVAALRSKIPAMVALLLDNGANPKAKFKEGLTAFDFIKKNENLQGTDVYWRLNDLTFN